MRGVALPRRDLQRVRALEIQNAVFEENDVKKINGVLEFAWKNKKNVRFCMNETFRRAF